MKKTCTYMLQNVSKCYIHLLDCSIFSMNSNMLYAEHSHAGAGFWVVPGFVFPVISQILCPTQSSVWAAPSKHGLDNWKVKTKSVDLGKNKDKCFAGYI